VWRGRRRRRSVMGRDLPEGRPRHGRRGCRSRISRPQTA
jgi:hypothetical protein